jgi:hypothetical protein
MSEGRPTGIIRNLPWATSRVLGYKPDKRNRREALKRIVKLFSYLKEDEGAIYMSMPAKPRQEVLYCYILVDGRIRWRANISHFEPGDARKCVDGVERAPKYWMILTGPLVKAPRGLRMRGFRGFRYTEGFDGF